jgi:hypothetical protein
LNEYFIFGGSAVAQVVEEQRCASVAAEREVQLRQVSIPPRHAAGFNELVHAAGEQLF